MRIYRGVWRVTVVVLVATSLVAGVATVGWVALGVAVGCSAVLGCMFGLTWEAAPGAQRRAVLRAATWFGLTGVLVFGLPGVLGPWTLLVLMVVGGLAPGVVETGLRVRRSRLPAPRTDDPARLSDQDLARRWVCTTEELRAGSLAPATVLEVAQERSALLDEIERRDPEDFVAWLVRTGERRQERDGSPDD